MNYSTSSNEALYERDDEKLEIVTVSVGFDDVLDVTLPENHHQCDHLIVVTSHADKKTQAVCQKHGVTCVQTDTFERYDNEFRKGAGINRGFDFFQYYGWRLHIDSDIILPDNFNRLLFNHASLDNQTIYGCDRIDVVGLEELKGIKSSLHHTPQHAHGFLIRPAHDRPIGSRYLDNSDGYCPIGFFQLWNARCHKAYPSSKGDASHDDVSFAKLWPRKNRQVLPIGFCYHLIPEANPEIGKNWKGKTQKNIK